MDMPPLGNVCAWCTHYVVKSKVCACPCVGNILHYSRRPDNECDCRDFTLVEDMQRRVDEVRDV